VNGQWTEARVINIILKGNDVDPTPSPSSTPTSTGQTTSTPIGISFSGMTWNPIYVTYGNHSGNGYGDWRTEGGVLKIDQATPLHYKVVASSMSDMTNYEAQIVANYRSQKQLGVCARMDANGNGYCFATDGTVNNTFIAKYKNNDQNPEVIQVGVPYEVSYGSDYVLKIKVQGNTIYGKVFALGIAEPSDWNVVVNDGQFSSGKAGIYTYGTKVDVKSATVNPLSSANVSNTQSDQLANISLVLKSWLGGLLNQ
jgi:hypothetical protein